MLGLSRKLTGVEIFNIFIIPLLISGTAYIVFYHDFLLGDSIFWPSIIISLFIALFVVISVVRSHKNGRWNAQGDHVIFYGAKKIYIFLILSLCVFYIFFINLSYVLPRVFTSFLGEEGYVIDLAHVNKHAGRRCESSIESKSMQGLFFKICTSRAFYEENKNVVFKIGVNFKESYFGVIVKDVKKI